MESTKTKTNYYFIDNKAYTEDDLLVYNVFVYQLPSKITPQEVLKYFLQFGEVINVDLASGREDTKCAFIHFTNPVAAAKALQRSNHVLQKKRFFVRACESWDQPIGSQDSVVDVNTSDAAEMDLIDFGHNIPHKPPGILQLNDDCLDVICGKLALRDQIRFARVCKRFRNIFLNATKWEYRTFDMNKLIGMTLWDIRECFEMIGANIERLVGSVPYNYQDRIEFVSELCPYVTSVDFNCNNVETTSLLQLLERMKGVEDLQLQNFSLSDNAVLALRKLPNLRILTLKWCYELTGKNLCKLRDLTELSLFGCENLQTTHFIEICKSLKQLKTLDIRHCKMLTTHAYNEMVKHCNNLEKLKMSCEKDVEYECVAYMQPLKYLEVYSFATVRDEFFARVGAYKGTELEYLEISARNCITYTRAVQLSLLRQLKQLICPFNDNLDDECLCEFGYLQNLENLDIRNCRSITNVGLLVLLRRCLHLQTVNVERCENISDDFVYEALDVLKQSPYERNQPVVFHVWGTNIHESILHELQYIAVEKLLKLSFINPES